FLAAGAAKKERGLYLGFNESPQEIVARGEGAKIDLAGYVRRGILEILWEPTTEVILDAIARRVLDIVRRTRVRRLFLDGLDGLTEAGVYPERMSRFFAALTRTLRNLGVTTIITEEARVLFGPEVEMPGGRLRVRVDNMILVRHVELRSQLHRLISILKMRDSAFDSEIREVRINGRGIDVSNN